MQQTDMNSVRKETVNTKEVEYELNSVRVTKLYWLTVRL